EGTEPGTVFNAVAAAGFTCAKYNVAYSGLAPMPETMTEAQAGSVAEAARESGVESVAVSGTVNMIHPDPAVREAGLR
ncbi:sugar phosphate isomerase/epimerase, partial [Rhizobium ruizarguesonis]